MNHDLQPEPDPGLLSERVVLDFTDVELNWQFGALRDVIRIAERALAEELKRFEQRLNDERQGMTQEEALEHFRETGPEVLWIEEHLPNTIRKGLFLACYAEIEGYLDSICHQAQKQNDVQFSVEDITGHGIQRAKRYLARVISSSSLFSSSEWKRLTDYNKLRNIIAHAQGKLSASQKTGPIGDLIKTDSLLTCDSYDGIIIRQRFCEEVVETALRFFRLFPRDLRR